MDEVASFDSQGGRKTTAGRFTLAGILPLQSQAVEQLRSFGGKRLAACVMEWGD